MDHEVHGNYINIFSEEKKYHSRERTILGAKMVLPYNSGSTLRVFLKFYTIKGANRYMELTLMVFLKKFSVGAVKLCHFDLKISRCQNSGSTLRILHNERGQEVHEN